MRWLVCLIALAACAGAPPATRFSTGTPAVTLYRDTVVVVMPDGAVCTAVRPGRAGPWSGTLAGCPMPWPVRVLRPTDRPRLPLAPAEAAPWVTLAPPGAPVQGFGPRAGT